MRKPLLTLFFLSLFISSYSQNHAPIAKNDTFNYPMYDRYKVVDIRSNDIDPDGDQLSEPRIIQFPSYGYVSIMANGILRYIGHDSPYSSTLIDSLSYAVYDNRSPALGDTAVLYIRYIPGSCYVNYSYEIDTILYTLSIHPTGDTTHKQWAWKLVQRSAPGQFFSSSIKEPVFTIPAEGSYILSLLYKDPSFPDCEIRNSRIINIYYRDSCAADFTVSNHSIDTMYSGVSGTPRQFINMSPNNADSVKWDFGDGTTSHELNPLHNFLPGRYYVCLTIYNEGCIVTKCDSVIVTTRSNTIRKMFFLDTNRDGIRSHQEPAIPGIEVTVQPIGTKDISSSHGDIWVDVQKGIYVLQFTLPPGWIMTTPASNLYVPFYGYEGFDYGDIGLSPSASLYNNLNISITNLTPIRPGFDATFLLVAQNRGTDIMDSGSISLQYDPVLMYNNSSVSPTTHDVVNNKLTWNYDSLLPRSSVSIKVHFHSPPPPELSIGDTVCMRASVLPINGDILPLDNISDRCVLVSGSYDPNDKSVYPAGEGINGNIPTSTDELTYLIRFQNTGTDTAFRVRVVDTLDYDFNHDSLITITTSHPLTAAYVINGIATWDFQNILLPDSNINEPASHGYILYSIKPKRNLSEGTTFTNSAAIYFDFNAPVITNTTLNTLGIPISTGINVQKKNQLRVYPVPASKTFTIEFAKEINSGNLLIRDMMGRKVKEQKNVTTRQTIDVTDLTPGIYILELNNPQSGTTAVKLMIE